MAKTDSKNYISNGFQDRIEVNLANISQSPGDKFVLVGVKYVPASFKCELCGHDPCLYSYAVKNLETGIVIEVGSECIKHFEKEGCNIDLAAGLQKRVKSVTRKMRRYMKKYLESSEYKNLNKETKREITLRLFMKHQTIERLKGETKKAFLSKEEVLEIIKNTPEVQAKPKKKKVRKVKSKKVEKPMTALEIAEKEVKDLSSKDSLTEDEKKYLRRAKDRVRYYKNKVA